MADDGLTSDEPQAAIDRNQPEFDFDDLPVVERAAVVVTHGIAVETPRMATPVMTEAEPVVETAPTAPTIAVADPLAESPIADAAVIQAAVVETAVVEPTPVVALAAETVEAPVFEAAPSETAAAESTLDFAAEPTKEQAVTFTAPEVAAELVNDIAAPQYGIGLQLFEPLPHATAVIPADDDHDNKA